LIRKGIALRQIIQHLDSGKTELITAPAPRARPGTLVISTRVTIVSAGTERMLVDFGKAGLLTKARQQPDKVRMVLDKVRTEGLITTFEGVRSKLRQPLPLGYCNVGEVIEVGTGVDGFAIGDRVVCNGPHAEIVRVPKNLCARIPDSVDDASASIVVVASIALQGLRLAEPTIGETFVVIGAGLIGLLAVQLLRAQGCQVLAVDLDEKKLALARQFGAQTCNIKQGENPVSAGMVFSRGRGVDGVIITASTKSSEPVSQAAKMCRKRGRIILVGVAGLNLNRADFYEKELSFQVSCSYGPGRYDAGYEEGGNDYPLGFVRWTEQRNFEAVLDLLEAGKLSAEPLISHRFNFEDAAEAYERLRSDCGALGILLEFSRLLKERTVASIDLHPVLRVDEKPVLGFIGAGNYASRILVPAFQKANACLYAIATEGGVSAAVQGRAGGFKVAVNDSDALMNDDRINAIVIATRHDSHAQLASRALSAGKHVFVEKPLAVSLASLNDVRKAFDEAHRNGTGPQLMVGFNRRFAPHIIKARAYLSTGSAPKSMILTMNAGAIPASHWTQDREKGGGRIIGEACHLIDVARFLAGSPIVGVGARAMVDVGDNKDTATISLSFEDGSIATIHYFANGHSSFPKERIEIFTDGRVLQIDNFLKMSGFGWGAFSGHRLMRQDKGQKACAAAFIRAIETGTPAIPVAELFEVTEATLEAAGQLTSR
jgi:predicted dehydrogenase/threonine dehydrogenase-like Zn-dependent dehydrogenase